MDSDILYSLDNSNCVNPSISMTCELMTGLLIPVTVGPLQGHASFVDRVALLIHLRGSHRFFRIAGLAMVSPVRLQELLFRACQSKVTFGKIGELGVTVIRLNLLGIQHGNDLPLALVDVIQKKGV